MSSRVLVTGAAGFIGSHLARGLLEKGYGVSVLDNFLTGRRENLEEVVGDLEAFHEADVRDFNACLAAAEGMDVVFHLAALPSVQASIENPILTNDINLNGTLNMLLASREKRVGRFIFASSAAVYGDSAQIPKSEDLPASPLSPYSLQKLTGERYCLLFNRLYGMETVSFRYFNIFGPGQDPKSTYAAVIPLFTSAILEGRSPMIFGDGEQTRDFTYIRDVISANLLAMDADSLSGEVVNIASGKSCSINALLDSLKRTVGTEVKSENAPPRQGDIRDSQADISFARQVLGYTPKITFEEGVRETFEAAKERFESRVPGPG